MQKILCFIFIFSVSNLYASGNKGKGGMKMYQDLNLTDEQVSKLKAFKKNQQEKREKIKSSCKTKHEKMKELFIQGKPDSELQTMHEEIKSGCRPKGDIRFERMLFLKNLLDQKQRKIFIQNKNEYRKKAHKEK
jgi:Spy/CpxP family protein refolding chaperone